MKKILLLPLIALVILSSCAKEETTDKVEMTTYMDTVSYAIGTVLGGQARQGIKEIKDSLDKAKLLVGFKKALDSNAVFTEEEMKQILTGFNQKMVEAENIKLLSKHDETINQWAAIEGVQRTESGLMYKIIEEGNGKTPDANDTVAVNYKGSFSNGVTFDANNPEAGAARFMVSQVIPGWKEGLQLMKTGSKVEFYIPHTLAYGPQGVPSRGQGGGIPPYSPLKFDVELLEVIAVEGTEIKRPEQPNIDVNF